MSIKRQAGAAAAKLSDARIRGHIAAFAGDKKSAMRAEGYLIRYYGSRALDALVEACSHADPNVRFRAVYTLGYIQDPAAYETVLRMVDDPDATVRYDAAIALGVLGDERAIEPLIALMCVPDPEGSVDGAAATGLVRLGECAIPALLKLLDVAEKAVRNTAAYVLGSIGSEQAIEPLARLLASPDDDTRIAGVEALAEIGTPACIALVEGMQYDSAMRVRNNARYWYKELAGGGSSRA